MRLRRRHLKDNVKVFIKRTVIFIISALMLWGAIICIKDINNPENDKNTSGGKEINKEEYVYKEELLDLGYDVKDVELISTKISNVDVKKYLLTEKRIQNSGSSFKLIILNSSPNESELSSLSNINLYINFIFHFIIITSFYIIVYIINVTNLNNIVYIGSCSR